MILSFLRWDDLQIVEVVSNGLENCTGATLVVVDPDTIIVAVDCVCSECVELVCECDDSESVDSVKVTESDFVADGSDWVVAISVPLVDPAVNKLERFWMFVVREPKAWERIELEGPVVLCDSGVDDGDIV